MRRTIGLTGCLLAFAVLAAGGASAQSWGPRGLEELKQEAQRRADNRLPPVGSIKSDDMKEALSNIGSLEPDVWAAAFSRIGGRYMAQGKAQEAASPKEARESYYNAWHVYNTARWPTENSAGKKQAYARALEAFAAYARLSDPPIETIRIPFEGKEIIAYLRLPPNVRPAPLLFGISGLDTRKEDVAATSDLFLRRGIGLLAIDMPGTGQAPVKVEVGAERIYSRVLDYLQTRKDVDAGRIVVRGQSWAGYWAALMAYKERDRLRGAVVHGVGIHGYFQPEWQKKALFTREYLFDLFPARAAVYGVTTEEDFLAYGPRLSLLDQGYLGKPSAPMLLVNGEKDTQQPIADLYLLMKNGDPKDVWVNPDGGHMGRSKQWTQGRIVNTVVAPWIDRMLGAPAAKPRP
jgi:pimeloyl-ACP methyl ester carboxylesterase